MAGVVSAIFGGGSPPGPDPEILEAQRRQEARIAAQEAEEEEKKAARDRLVAATQGRRSLATLFQRTGEAGLSRTLGGSGGQQA